MNCRLQLGIQNLRVQDVSKAEEVSHLSSTQVQQINFFLQGVIGTQPEIS